MKKGLLITLGVIIVIIVIIGGSLMGAYNGLVGERENVTAKLKNIDTDLQRRADLIPNLVSTVKGFAEQEKTIMANITDARAKLSGATTPATKAAANDELSGALSRLLVVVEAYPNLKSDANFRQLMDELAGTENRIKVSRVDYNNAVQLYDTHIKTFPTSILAGMFGFEQAEYFEASESSKEVPNVDFTSSK